MVVVVVVQTEESQSPGMLNYVTMLIDGGGVLGCVTWCGVISCPHQFAPENQRRNQWKQRRKDGYFAICTVAKLLQKEKWRSCSL